MVGVVQKEEVHLPATGSEEKLAMMRGKSTEDENTLRIMKADSMYQSNNMSP